jgi:hypothetical protein
MRGARLLRIGVVTLASALAVVAPARATTLTFEYGFEFSGATAPAGPAPWLTATFDDEVNPGFVRLTMDTADLTGDEFVDGNGTGKGGWYFNLNPLFNPNQLTFGFISGNDADNILKGIDAYQADGDGRYDIRFTWNSASPFRLSAGQTAVYDIAGIPGLTVNDFNFDSAPAGGKGPFLSAAKVQGIGLQAESGWVAPTTVTITQVPEPTALVLFGVALLGFGYWTRRRRVPAVQSDGSATEVSVTENS